MCESSCLLVCNCVLGLLLLVPLLLVVLSALPFPRRAFRRTPHMLALGILLSRSPFHKRIPTHVSGRRVAASVQNGYQNRHTQKQETAVAK